MLRTLFLAFTQNPNFTNKTSEIYNFMSNIYASIKLKFRQLFWGTEQLLKMFDSKIWHKWKKKKKNESEGFCLQNEMKWEVQYTYSVLILNQLIF